MFCGPLDDTGMFCGPLLNDKRYLATPNITPNQIPGIYSMDILV